MAPAGCARRHPAPRPHTFSLSARPPRLGAMRGVDGARAARVARRCRALACAWAAAISLAALCTVWVLRAGGAGAQQRQRAAARQLEPVEHPAAVVARSAAVLAAASVAPAAAAGAHGEAHAFAARACSRAGNTALEYDGAVVKWGPHNKQSDAAACSASCEATEGCAVWVGCFNSERCAEQLGDCWLKKVDAAHHEVGALPKTRTFDRRWTSGVRCGEGGWFTLAGIAAAVASRDAERLERRNRVGNPVVFVDVRLADEAPPRRMTLVAYAHEVDAERAALRPCFQLPVCTFARRLHFGALARVFGRRHTLTRVRLHRFAPVASRRPRLSRSLQSPNAAENLRLMATGERGGDYKLEGAVFYRVIDMFIDQTGVNARSGGSALTGKAFDDDPGGLALKHDRPGLLSAANAGAHGQPHTALRARALASARTRTHHARTCDLTNLLPDHSQAKTQIPATSASSSPLHLTWTAHTPYLARFSKGRCESPVVTQPRPHHVPRAFAPCASDDARVTDLLSLFLPNLSFSLVRRTSCGTSTALPIHKRTRHRRIGRRL